MEPGREEKTRIPEAETPGFEQLDIQKLRSHIKRPSIWSRMGDATKSFVARGIVRTAVLGVAIIATIALGLLALSGAL